MTEVEKTGLWGIVVLTLLVVLVMGPGMWSSTDSSPLRYLWNWLKRTFQRPSKP